MCLNGVVSAKSHGTTNENEWTITLHKSSNVVWHHMWWGNCVGHAVDSRSGRMQRLAEIKRKKEKWVVLVYSVYSRNLFDSGESMETKSWIVSEWDRHVWALCIFCGDRFFLSLVRTPEKDCRNESNEDKDICFVDEGDLPAFRPQQTNSIWQEVHELAASEWMDCDTAMATGLRMHHSPKRHDVDIGRILCWLWQLVLMW